MNIYSSNSNWEYLKMRQKTKEKMGGWEKGERWKHVGRKKTHNEMVGESRSCLKIWSHSHTLTLTLTHTLTQDITRLVLEHCVEWITNDRHEIELQKMTHTLGKWAVPQNQIISKCRETQTRPNNKEEQSVILPLSRRCAILTPLLSITLISSTPPPPSFARERRSKKIIPLEDYLTSR